MKLSNYFALLLLLFSPLLSAADGFGHAFNLTQGVTSLSREMYSLHMLVFWVCIGIGVVVFGFMFYIMWFHRRTKRPQADQFYENHKAEVIWTIIPLIIVIVLIVPAYRGIISAYDTSESDVEIKVSGRQWKWEYEYLGRGLSFLSQLATPLDEINNVVDKGQYYLREVNNPLVIPTGKKVVFKITSNDVIHSWWVPDLGVKRDAIPGYVTEAWTRVEKPGLYFGACAELCGVNHAFMPVVVKAVSPEEFSVYLEEKKQQIAEEKRLAQQQQSFSDLMVRGKAAYERSCAACHGVSGEGLGTVFPALAANEAMIDDLQNHIRVVVEGVNGTAMQGFGDQLSELDIAAIITYERNAWGNNSGDTVQPLDILNFKKNAQ